MGGDSDNESGNSAATVATRQSQETLENFDEDGYLTKMINLGKQQTLTAEKLLNWAIAKVAQRRAELQEKADREAKRAEERLEREREREHPLELARLGAQSSASGGTSQSGCRPRERAPPMQKYEDDGNQPLETYLHSFESLVAASEGTEAEKIRWLLTSMPPRLVALVNELNVTQLKDYEKVKSTLLASQNFSPAECRARFVSAFPLKEENCSTFGHRKARLFSDWLRVTKCPECKLLPFLIFDSIANNLPTDVLAYVRTQLKDEVDFDRSLATLDEYLQHNQPGVRLCDVMRARRADSKARPQNAFSPAAGNDPSRKGDHKNGKHKGHSQNNKPHAPSPKSPKPSSSRASSPKKEESVKPKHHPIRGKGNPPGSHSQGYPSNQKNSHYPHFSSGGQYHRPPTHSANAVDARPERAIDDTAENPQYDAATLQFTESGDPQLVPECPGTVNGVAAEIALDTGASGIFVDQKFVKDEDYTGQVVRLRVADGEPQLRRCCVINLDCRYYKGKAPAVALI